MARKFWWATIGNLMLALLLAGSAQATDILIYNGDDDLEIDENRVILDANDTGGNVTLQFGNAVGAFLRHDATTFVFNDDVSFSGSQIIDYRIENLAVAPTCNAGARGREYFNTTNNKAFVCNGTNWVTTTFEVVDDLTPQLGGTLDVNNQAIGSANDGDVVIQPDGSGDFRVNANDIYVDTSASRVGIGDSTLETKLHVAGGILSEETNNAAAPVININWDNANQQTVVLNQAGHTVTFSGNSAGQIMRLIVCQDGTGNRTITSWPAAVDWKNGSAPTLQTAANRCDVLNFISTEARGGLEVFGSMVSNF